MKDPRPPLGKAETWIALVVVLFVLAMVAAGIWAGGAQTLAAFESLNFGAVLVLLSLSLVNYFARTIRWLSLSRFLGIDIPAPANALYYVAGFSMTTTPGKMGESLRLWFMRSRYRLSYDRTLALMVGDRVFDAVAMALLVLATALFMRDQLWLSLLTGAAVAMMTFALFYQGFPLRIANFVYTRIAITPRAAVRIRRLLSLIDRLAHPVNFSAQTALSVLGWLSECVAFALVLRFLHLSVPVPVAIFIFSFSMIMGAVSFLPGGLGGFEIAAVALLTTQHVPLALAVAATAIVRLTTLWFAVFLGFLALPLAFIQLRRGVAMS